MRYEIENRSDFGTGAQLITKIPEIDLDKKALHTIQTDRPDFIFPFHYRNIDGEVEFVYEPGILKKIPYNPSAISVPEYCKLWYSLLDPLLSCADWFMKPYSFVLDPNYIFFDDASSSIRYAYIPSVHDCSDYNTLKEAAVSLSKHVSIEDVNLENRVLRSIMKDFSPAELLQTLKQYEAENARTEPQRPVVSPQNDQHAPQMKKQAHSGGDRSQARVSSYQGDPPYQYDSPQHGESPYQGDSHTAQAGQPQQAQKAPRSQALQKAPSLPMQLPQEAAQAKSDISILEHDEYELIDGDSDSPLDIIINIPLKRKRAKSADKQPKRKNAFSAFASR